MIKIILLNQRKEITDETIEYIKNNNIDKFEIYFVDNIFIQIHL